MNQTVQNADKYDRVDLLRYDPSLSIPQLPYTPIFGDKWHRIKLPASPRNTSATTQMELAELLQHQSDILCYKDEIIRLDHTNIEIEYANLLEAEKIAIADEVLNKLHLISSELEAIVHYYKCVYNRPRPRQLLKEIGRVDENYEIASELCRSPSYPSVVATKSRFFDLLLSHPYEDHKKKLYTLTNKHNFYRVLAGFHYPSDVDAGTELAESLYKLQTIAFTSDIFIGY